MVSEYQLTELGEIPNEWEISEIAGIGHIITGSTPKTVDKDNYGNEYLFVSPIDLGSKKYVDTTQKQLTKKGFNLTRHIPKGSVLVTCIGSTIGKTGIATNELSTNQQINSIVCNNICDSEFIYYAIDYNFKNYRKYISNQAVPIIKKSLFSEFPIQVPPLKEQQKIAAIFSSVDEAIEKTEQIIEQTEKVKKALTPKLLTEGIRHTKFKKTPIGKMPDVWEIVNLEKVCDILDGTRKPIKKADRDKIDGDIPYYGASGVIDWVNDYLFNEPLILLAEDGENLKSRSLPIAFKIEGKTWVNNHAHVLRPNQSIDIDFLELYLESLDYEKYITGSAQPKLNQKVSRTIKIKLPELKEQIKIGEIVKEHQEKIDTEKKKLKMIQLIKQGLMQQLLTGKVRVPIDDNEVV